MKRYNLAYYFLTVLLIMGGFAAMAQNGYGLIILGLVALAFGFIFLYQFAQQWKKNDQHKLDRMIELGALFVLSVLFACKIFYFEIPFLDSLIELLAILLLFIYARRLIGQYRNFSSHPSIALRIALFYLSVILLILSLITSNVNAWVAAVAGAVGLGLFLVFFVSGLLGKRTSAEGENLSAAAIIAHRSNCSWPLIALLSIFTLYWELTRTNVLPRLYSDQYPQAYFELVEQANAGKEKPVNGVYRYELFKKNYEEFLKRLNEKAPQ